MTILKFGFFLSFGAAATKLLFGLEAAWGWVIYPYVGAITLTCLQIVVLIWTILVHGIEP